MTARRSSIRSSSVATDTSRSETPVPRLSNWIKRVNDPRSRRKRARCASSQPISTLLTNPWTRRRSRSPSPNAWYAIWTPSVVSAYLVSGNSTVATVSIRPGPNGASGSTRGRAQQPRAPGCPQECVPPNNGPWCLRSPGRRRRCDGTAIATPDATQSKSLCAVLVGRAPSFGHIERWTVTVLVGDGCPQLSLASVLLGFALGASEPVRRLASIRVPRPGMPEDRRASPAPRTDLPTRT